LNCEIKMSTSTVELEKEHVHQNVIDSDDVTLTVSTQPEDEHVIRVGTRKSQLALIQTNKVVHMLKSLVPNVKFETLPMSTTGDKILDSALSKIGEKSLFTKELENALLKHQVDFVVHSLKDLPTTLPEGLVIGCVCKRDNPFDAVVMHPKHVNKKLKDLPAGSVIGTSSLRRAAQMKRLYPHLRIENIRGNLNTRFQKLQEANIYDAIILAVAGLERMRWDSAISQVLTPEECMYAVAQGAMAVECRSDDLETLELLKKLHDHSTTLTCVAERAYLRKLEGGCSVPVSAFTELSDNEICIKGGVFTMEGDECVTDTVTRPLDFPENEIPEDEAFVGIHCQDPSRKKEYTAAMTAGVELASAMIKKGADKILAEAKAKTKQEIIEEHAARQRKKEAMNAQQDGATASGSKGELMEGETPSKKHCPDATAAV